MDVILDFVKQIPVTRIIMTVCLLALCLLAMKVILIFVDKCLKRSKMDKLPRKILRMITKGFLLFTIVIIVLSSLGVSVSSLIAAFSVIGVAFSLAIQDFLGNVFGGIQIISNHPFQIGDYVEAGGEAGTVREVGLFYTKLDTPDKKLILIPNSKIANDSVVNYSNAANRRLEFLVCVSYDDDVEKVRAVLLSLLSEHPMVLSEPDLAPAVHVKEFRDSDICYTARAWCENTNYWTVYFDIMDAIQPTLIKNGISLTYPHLNVHMLQK
jgi:small conductance mechanosensitive channel